MLWIKAFHIIFMVTWFAGLFYLPRLFVYHAQTYDELGNKRFKIMERKLYNFITMPAAILTTFLGIWLLTYTPMYLHSGWLHIKLGLVLVLWLYHLYCGYLVRIFRLDKNTFGSTFYRWFNEIPSLLLISIIILTVVKP